MMSSHSNTGGPNAGRREPTDAMPALQICSAGIGVRWWCVWLAAGLFAACGAGEHEAGADAGVDIGPGAHIEADADQVDADAEPIDYDEELAPMLAAAGAAPIEQAEDFDPVKLELGRMLFFDPILSGNRDTACSTCHRLDEGTSVDRTLVVGTKAVIRDGKRFPGPGLSFTPRTSPPLFNLGDQHKTSLLWDGRVNINDAGNFIISDTAWEQSESNVLRFLSSNLDNLLAAQAMMPVLAREEMRGFYGDEDIHGERNELAVVTDEDLDSVWARLTARLISVDGYRELLEQAYPDVAEEDVEFAHAANALSAFIIDAFTLTDSPWDRYLRGEQDALDEAQRRGAYLFYGKAQCASCHGGALQTDEQLHNIGVRPLGSGPSSYYDVDYGAVLRSHAGDDKKFAFRTPSLRNVELTGPWMHNGAFTTLEGAVRHHLDMRQSLWNYDASQLDDEFERYVHTRTEVLEEVEETLVDFGPVELSDEEVDDLVAFLGSLTSPSATELDHLEPDELPSGLDVPDP